MATAQELIAAARKAGAEGNTASEERLKAAARAQLQVEEQASSAPSLGNKALDTYADFGRGVTSGLKNASHIGQKLLWRGAEAMGMEGAGDLLDVVNAKQLANSKEMEAYRNRSPVAFGIGKATGESLFTAPIGGAAGTAGRLALGGKGILAAGAGLAAEGAATGAYLADGKDVLQNAALGAGINVVGGSIINGVTRAGGEVIRTVANKARAMREVAGGLDDATRRVEQAAVDGGYTLDGSTAHATTRTYDETARLRKDPAIDQRFQDHRAMVEGQVTDKAKGLAAKYGPMDDALSYQTAYQTAQRSLTALKQLDVRAYKNAYRAFDRLAEQTDTRLPTDQLYAKLDEFITQNGNAASASIAGKINKDLARYGITPRTFERVNITGLRAPGELEVLPNGAPDPYGVSPTKQAPADPYFFPKEGVEGAKVSPAGGSRSVEIENLTGKPNPYGVPQAKPNVPKPLSLENVEDLIQDINAHWSPNLSNGEKAYIGKVKGLLEEHVDTALKEMGEKAGVGSEVYAAGKAARDARRAFSENWEAKDIIQKVTERTAKGEWALDYSQIAQKLSGQDGAKSLATIKARLMLKPGGDKAWKSMQQAPLMEALYEATKDTTESVMEGGVIKFNHKAFERVLNRQLKTQAAKEVLYGKEGAAEIQKAIDAWKLRFRRPDTSGSVNTSNTAMTLLKQLRFLPSGRTRNVGMAVAGAVPVLGESLQRGAREQAADAILRGSTIPKNVQEELAADILSQWEEDFVGAGGQKYGNVLRSLLRTGAVIQFTDE